METAGCGTALVTPFRADGSIDEHALRALVNWQVDAGIDFLVACGSTGEAATLDEEEWLRAVQIVADAAGGRVPVWAGCTHNSTRALVHMAELLRKVRGVDAILSANPYYNKPTQEGQYQHFLALAEAVAPIPVVLYNVPGRTAANLEPETVVRLASTASNIEAIKEASGKLSQIAALLHSLQRSFKVFSGDDNMALATIGIGAHGLVSVASNEAPLEMGPHGSCGTAQCRGDGPSTGTALRAFVRSQLLGVESWPGQDRSESYGPNHRRDAASARSTHCGYTRQTGAARGGTGAAEVCPAAHRRLAPVLIR